MLHSIWVILCVTSLLKLECKVDAGTSKRNFETTTRTQCFVDKTLFIRDFLNDDPNDPEVKVITAPDGFGKSTVIDMLQRFFSNEFNSSGKYAHYKNNLNYDTFCKKPLNICANNTKYLAKHFGKYPVISINFSPLEHIKDFGTFLNAMRYVLFVTYKQHKYLLKEDFVWPTCCLKKEGFQRRVILDTHLNESDIWNGFILLAELLHEYFGKKVVILVDEYDAYCQPLLFQNANDIDRILMFLSSMTKQLFRYNDHLERGLLTGVFSLKDAGISPAGDNFEEYRFQENHKFSKYYGFTEEEVRSIVSNIVISPEKRGQVHTILKKYYGGYSVLRQEETTLCRPLSVVKFFRNQMKPDNYWVRTDLLDRISKISNISTIIQNLMVGGSATVNFDGPFTKHKMLELMKMNGNLKISRECEKEFFFRFLFDLGFFGFVFENSLNPLVKVKIPNLETQLEFGRLMSENILADSNFKRVDVKFYQESFNSFVVNNNSWSQTFKLFHRRVSDLFHNSDCPVSETDVYSILLGFAAEKFELGKTFLTNNMNKFKGKPKKFDIVVFNNNDMAIIMNIKYRDKSFKYRLVKSKHLAVDEHADLLSRYGSSIDKTSNILHSQNLKGAIYIGIGFKEKGRDISIVASTSYSNESFVCRH